MITQSRYVTFRHRGVDWHYKLWLDERGWYWTVGSQDGIEQTEAEASESAREYIRGRRLQAVPSEGKD